MTSKVKVVTKNPRTADAIQFTGSNYLEITKFVKPFKAVLSIGDTSLSYTINSLANTKHAFGHLSEGDWLIWYMDGREHKFRSLTDKEFKANWEPVNKRDYTQEAVDFVNSILGFTGDDEIQLNEETQLLSIPAMPNILFDFYANMIADATKKGLRWG